MSKPAINLYFGVYLDGDEAQFQIYDDSAATWIDYTIPKGLYFYNHPTNSKNIVWIINQLTVGLMTLNRSNDRQLLFDMTAAADDFRLKVTDNDDGYKLAEMLGLYDNSGDLLYYTQATIADGKISQVSLTNWYSAGGRVHEYATERGFKSHGGIYTAAQSGYTAGVSTGARKIAKTLTFTAVDMDDVRTEDETGTQAVIGTTLNPDWTTSFWRAYSPHYHAPVWYGELQTPNSSEYITGEWWITDPIEPENCKPTNAQAAVLFDLTVSTSFIDVAEQEYFLYCGSGLNAYINSGVNALWSIPGSISILLRWYHVGGQSTGNTLFTIRSTTVTNSIVALIVLNATTRQLTWYQGDAAAFEYFATGLYVVNNDWNEIMVTRSGSTGANAISFALNGTTVNISPTKTPGTVNHALGLMDQYGGVSNNVYGYPAHLSIYNRVLSAAEKANNLLGIRPSPETSVGYWDFTELGGLIHLDQGPNKIPLTSVATSWAVIP